MVTSGSSGTKRGEGRDVRTCSRLFSHTSGSRAPGAVTLLRAGCDYVPLRHTLKKHFGVGIDACVAPRPLEVISASGSAPRLRVKHVAHTYPATHALTHSRLHCSTPPCTARSQCRPSARCRAQRHPCSPS